jgi:CHAT domain-containing protein
MPAARPAAKKKVSCPNEGWMTKLSRETDERARKRIVRQQSLAGGRKLIDELYEEVVKLVRIDLLRADRVAEASSWLAERLDDDYARAQSFRARGHVQYLSRNFRQALEFHRNATEILLRLGNERDAARAMVNQLQPLIYLGRYPEAYTLADGARRIYKKIGDHLRLARLDANVANILHRLDRFRGALALYRRAYEYFLEHGNVEDIAVVLRNMAVCYISLNRFEQALRTYEEARDYCQKHEMPRLVAEADYNVAYLHYLRGEYMRAIELYDATRVYCQELNDRYHAALCDLDQAELYLELNLSEEGSNLAHRAHAGFQKLGMGYEAAKALTFQAIAAGQLGKTPQALTLFDNARELFVRETNQFWPALIDIYKALVLIERKEDEKARALCESALVYFRPSPALGKAATCELILAQLDLRAGQAERANQHCAAALELLKTAELPALEFQVYVVRGQVQEALGQVGDAYETLLRAHKTLEGLRSHLVGEEFKIAFLKDKVSFYESLVCLVLAQDRAEAGFRNAFEFIEQAKSRSLADLIRFSFYALEPKQAQGREQVSHLQELRRQLIFTYRQAQRGEMSGDEDKTAEIRRLRRKSREYERQIATALADLPVVDQDFKALLNAGTASLEEVRACLPAGSLLLEYYQARGTIYACVVGSKCVQVLPVASVSHVRQSFRLLQFQLSKFRLGEEYVRNFGPALQFAAQTHLQEIYSSLIQPVRRHLEADHLVIVPHGFLHLLPFHALWEGNQFLSDQFEISYAPSASVYQLCSKRELEPQSESLVFGVPDQLAPHIAHEAQSVASVLPGAHLFLGKHATREVLWEYAPKSRFIHIATHGLFRQDNPMFSSVRLGRSDLNLFDLYQLRLSSELVTLSGCGTGLNVVVGGDELLGLVRGLLYAGTQAVLASLWEVNDESTSVLMRSFYQELSRTTNKAAALRVAMRNLREKYPHPYHWAPFVLIGRFDAN